MKLVVETVDGKEFTIEDMGHDSVMPMVEAFGDDSVSVLAFEMDDAMAYVNKRNIVRIIVD